MSIAERARELATKYMGANCMEHCWCQYSELLSKGSEYVSCEDKLVGLIEQALLAERRLAMEGLSALLAEFFSTSEFGEASLTTGMQQMYVKRTMLERLRAAAEKEVGK